MKQYDVRCPKCGAVNRGLYLKETGGRMECIGCGEVSRCLTGHRRQRCSGGESVRRAAFPASGLTSGQGA